MRYRVAASVYRRGSYPAAAVVLAVLFALIIRSDPTVTNLVSFSLLEAWAVVLGLRGWRSATLLATADKVTVRQLLWTTSLPWQQIEGFTAETMPTPWAPQVPIRVPRRVLGVRQRNGKTLWLTELSSRPAADGRSWVDVAAARLNELAELRVPSAGG